jgi:hypothetical protein
MEFVNFGNGTSTGIENKLQTICLSRRKIQNRKFQSSKLECVEEEEDIAQAAVDQ